MAKKSTERTTQGLRDILFEEITSLRSKNGDATKSMAVAKLAQQILNTAKVEMQFARTMIAAAESGQPIELGNMRLGSN